MCSVQCQVVEICFMYMDAGAGADACVQCLCFLAVVSTYIYIECLTKCFFADANALYKLL